MPAPRSFSDAERGVALDIVKRYSGMVSARCVMEVQTKLERYVSDRTLRNWWQEAHQPKRSHHKKRPENTDQSAPIFEEADGNSETSTERPDYSHLDRVGQVELLLDLLINRALTAEQIDTLGGRNLHTTIQGYLEKLTALRGLDENVLKLVPQMKRFVALCQRANFDPEQTLGDLVAHLESRLTTTLATNGELIQIESPINERIQP